MSFAWTEEQLEQAKKLWSDGLSATLIAEQMPGLTRGAVLGKLWRLGIRSPNIRIARQAGGCATGKLNAGRVRAQRNGGAAIAALKARAEKEREIAALAVNRDLRSIVVARAVAQGELPPVEAVMLPPEKMDRPPVALLDLRPNDCRWPLSDEHDNLLGFCGAPQGNQAPYCCKHAALAYRRRPPRNHRS